MLQKDEVYFFIIVGSFIFLLIALFLLLFVSYFLKKKRQVLSEKEQLEKQFTQALLQSQIEIKEQTLQHISGELHDNLGHVASLIKINLNTLQFEPIDKAIEKIEDTKGLVRQLITDIKSLSISLGNNHIQRLGLCHALYTDVERLNKTEKFIATFDTEGTVPVLETDKATILYRMAQEALNNIVKHSEATHIAVLLSGDEKKLSLVIRDNGIGFDPAQQIMTEGAGLDNLKKRASLINARLFIETAFNKGTCITIEMIP